MTEFSKEHNLGRNVMVVTVNRFGIEVKKLKTIMIGVKQRKRKIC